MKTNIKYSIVDLIASIIVLSISLIGFIVLVTARHFWGSVGYFIFFLIAIIMLLSSIKNIQWFDINNGDITVYCPFGIIKRVELNRIKKTFKTNATIYSIKIHQVRRPHIVLCLQKSVTKSRIENAYNRKKKPYIIIPYSTETEILICSEYKKLCGEELIIK